MADLSIDVTAPARAYDRAGQRVAFAAAQTVDCSVDLTGVPTTVTVAGHERWLGVFLRFTRLLSDPRTDGNSQQVYFRRDEHFEVVVRQGAEAAMGSASRVAMPEAELLLCDIRRTFAQTQILAADIDLSRRQSFVFAEADAVAVEAGTWTTLSPTAPNLQATLDGADAALSGHFSGASRRHAAAHIAFSPPTEIAGTTVQAALADLVSRLVSSTGAAGADFVKNLALTGTPHALAAGSVRSQLQSLLGWLNGHVGASSAAHAASAISAATHNWLTSTSVQAQLAEIAGSLASTNTGQGGARVGIGRIAGSVYALASGSVTSAIQSLLGHLNTHAAGGDHDDRYFRRTEQVADADTVDGQHASAFATAGHDHDDRYLRRIYQNSGYFDPLEARTVVTLTERPDTVWVAHNLLNPNGLPTATTYGWGPLSPDISWWVTKVAGSGSAKDFAVGVFNNTNQRLHISLSAYARD